MGQQHVGELLELILCQLIEGEPRLVVPLIDLKSASACWTKVSTSGEGREKAVGTEGEYLSC